MYRNYFFISCGVMSVFNACAANPDIYSQNFFWMPVASHNVDAVQGSIITDYIGYATARVTFPGEGNYRLLDKECYNNAVLKEPKGDITYWLQMKAGEQREPSTGLRFKVEFNDPRWEFPSNGSHLNGYVTKISQYKGYIFPGPNNRCWDFGTVTGVTFPSGLNRTVNLKITIPRADSYPGKYTLRVPVKWMLEERKFKGHSSTLHLGAAAKLQQYGVTSNILIPVEIHSKCTFNTSPINLSHGTMAGRNADGNQTKPYNFNVTCTPGTSVSVKLIGSQKVSGKTNNYTKCGTGGMCELTFDNGKYDETMTVDSSKTLSIKSTYRLNDITKPVAESFEGSGVLQVLVN